MYHKTHFNRGQEIPKGLSEYLDLASGILVIFLLLFVTPLAGFQRMQVFILVKAVQFNMGKLYISAF